jgi:hypothetical protein
VTFIPWRPAARLSPVPPVSGASAEIAVHRMSLKSVDVPEDRAAWLDGGAWPGAGWALSRTAPTDAAPQAGVRHDGGSGRRANSTRVCDHRGRLVKGTLYFL